MQNIYGTNEGKIEQSSLKIDDEIKLLTSKLGNAFKDDTENINESYTILYWE